MERIRKKDNEIRAAAYEKTIEYSLEVKEQADKLAA